MALLLLSAGLGSCPAAPAGTRTVMKTPMAVAYARRFVTVLALAISGWLLSGCAGLSPSLDSLKEPEVSLAGLALTDANPLGPRFLVRLKVDNPNDMEVSLDGAEVALALNGQPIASGTSRSPLSLARRGSTHVDVEVATDTLAVIQQILGLANRSSFDYGISGRLTVLDWLGPLGRIPFKFTGTMDWETLLRGAEVLGATHGISSPR